jgi:hypothetical protein
MRMIRSKLTYANVMSTIAVFLLLGGGAAFAASKLAKNSVGTKQIKKNAVTTAKIKKGAVTGAKIELSSVGTVPSATHAGTAGNAQTLGGLTSGQISEASKLRCPSGTQLAVGVCFEETVRPANILNLAMLECAEANRRLPTENELLTFEVRLPSAPPEEWVEPDYYDSGAFRGMTVSASKGGFSFDSKPEATSISFRCVTPPLN